MTIPGVANELAEFFSRLYYEQAWARWPVLAIAILALVLLISTGAGYLRTKAKRNKPYQGVQRKHWRTT
jgi:hypothetical protein